MKYEDVPKAKMVILKLLIEKYKENPCTTLSTAFWKILKPLSELETSIISDQNEIKKIIIKNGSQLLLYWQKFDSNDIDLTINVYKLNFFVIHNRYYNFIKSAQKIKLQKYFRLIHRFEKLPKQFLPQGFHFQTVDTIKDLQLVCSILKECYPGSLFTESVIKSWTFHPVFNPHLWIWILDSNNSKVALGIAEEDKIIPEASLEWIQVLPSYRKKGLGKALVYELLHRVKNNVPFVTVSGLQSNDSNPEQLYRSCGFTGSDIWLVFKRD